MNYVDGFVLAVPKARLADYKKLAKLGAKVWKEHGAIAYAECLEDDVAVGKLTSFPRSVKRTDDEFVVFSYIVYKSRKHRDEVMKKVMADKRMKMSMENAPFDTKRMIFGGFKTIVGY
ncbi:MAG TPA: DUF1428 domain-containing protein [Hyphomicrobium sp.]|nr:DUF1428 domain-containing protein [Hyphomicrobium sp.]